MKHIFTGFKLIAAFGLLALALGCAGTQTQTKENLLIAAGFKVIVPHTVAQQQKLQSLPPDKVTLVRKAGRRITFSRTQLTTRPTLVVLDSLKLTSSFV